MARPGLSSLSLSLSLSSLNWGPLLAFAELPICDLKGQVNRVRTDVRFEAIRACIEDRPVRFMNRSPPLGAALFAVRLLHAPLGVLVPLLRARPRLRVDPPVFFYPSVLPCASSSVVST